MGGWVEIPGSGSGHRQFKHPTKPGRVTVPFHGGNADLNHRTLNGIRQQSGLTLKES